MIKKIFKSILVVFLLVVISCSSIVNAYTNHTVDEAINWTKSQVGHGIDYDGGAGEQCVDLIFAYYDYLGVPVVYGNGSDFSWNELPIGWNRYQGVQPQRGDILVYTGSQYGHVAIYESDYSTYHQNFNGHNYVEQVSYKYDSFSTPYWGVVRPDFKDGQAPVIEKVYVDIPSMTSNTYKVKAKVTDNGTITSVKFPTWTLKEDANGESQDDLIWHEAVYNSSTGLYEFTIKASDHNNEIGIYRTHVYAYDNDGNSSKQILQFIPMGSTLNNNLPSDFYARITTSGMGDTSYVVGNSDKLVLSFKNDTDKSQIWHFKKNSDNTYSIINSYNNLYMDVQGNQNVGGSYFITHTSNSQDNQKFYLMNYNGGIRIVPKLSGDLKGMDLKGAQLIEGSNFELLESRTINKANQTFSFLKVATNMTISDTNITLNKNSNKKLSVTVTPSDTDNKNVYWSSSNESVATVDSNGVVTAKGVGNATISAITLDGSDITVNCNVTVTNKESSLFNDIYTDDWYYSAVKYVYENNIIKGYTNGNFGPNDNLTRAMLVTILHRMENEEKVSNKNNFSDVGNTWYTNAIDWASDKKIVMGYGDGTFKPNNKITRQDLMVILYRYAKYKGKNMSVNTDITNYPDYNKIDNYAKEAMKWAIGKKILYGNNSGLLDPKGNATRAQVAVIIQRYMQKIGK